MRVVGAKRYPGPFETDRLRADVCLRGDRSGCILNNLIGPRHD
jgi:hypothetical protein